MEMGGRVTGAGTSTIEVEGVPLLAQIWTTLQTTSDLMVPINKGGAPA